LAIALQSPTIKNAPLPADGPGNTSFSNFLLIFLIILVPTIIAWKLGGGLKTALFFTLITTVPTLICFWTIASAYSPRINNKAKHPGRPVEYYLAFKKEEDIRRYQGANKIPMQIFYEKYFDGEVDFNGDCLEVYNISFVILFGDMRRGERING